LRKYEKDFAKENPEINWDLLDDKQGNDWLILTKFILPFESIVRKAACPEIPPAPKLPEYGTHIISQFAYNIACACAFSDYYQTTRILTKDDSVHVKILFLKAIYQVLSNALELFMISPLDEM
jgi:arginyl-tRNA synthetase